MRASFEPAIDALPTVGAILLLLVGAWLVGRGQATPGDLVLAATLFSLLAVPLFIVGFFLEELPRSVVSLDRVDRVLDEPIAATPIASQRLPASGPLDLEIKDLVVGYGARRVLDGLSLRVRAGERVALVGATGSGKSTLLETVMGLNVASHGSIRLSGVELHKVNPAELQHAVALVFQEAFLFADSVATNVDLHSASEPQTAAAALNTAVASEFVAQLPDGELTVVGERGVTLSGGQRQRVALARALVRAPRLLLLDDATSAVDPVVEAKILSGIRAAFDTTMLMVAHRISVIELADRVAYLAGGRIVATGSHTELLKRDDYRSLITAYEQAAVS